MVLTRVWRSASGVAGPSCARSSSHAPAADVPAPRSRLGRKQIAPGRSAARDHDAADDVRLAGPHRVDTRGALMISGKTTLIAHLGYPTFAFKAPLIYNPWFEKNDIDAVVVPMGVQARGLPRVLPAAVQADQHPRRAGDDAAQGDHHRAGRRADADRAGGRRGQRRAACARTARCSATSSTAPGFVRGVAAQGLRRSQGKRALVVGNGGVGSPIAASLAAAGRGRAWGCSTRTPRRPRRSAERLARALPGRWR